MHMQSFLSNIIVISKAGKMFRILRFMQVGTLIISMLIIVWNVFFRSYQ